MRQDTRISERLKNIQPSSTLAITAKAKKLKSAGKDIVNLAAGEPDFDTPDFIKEKACEAIKNGFTKYTPSTGIPELKRKICEKFKRDNSLEYSDSQIVVSCGAKHSIFNALFALINPGDEVLIPTPFWVSYPEMVQLCQGLPRFIKTSAENNFKMTLQDLNRYVTPNTKLLILNSPANPTGLVYSRGELEAIAQFCVTRKVFVISDEIYEKIIFDSLQHFSIAAFNRNIYDLTFTVNGLSKSFSMTGWRIGYLGGPRDIVSAIAKLQDHTTSNPTSVSQKAALAALSDSDDFCRNICEEFQKRRDYLISRLNQMKKISYIKPQGTFYIFCDISRSKLDSLSICQRLLEEASVAVIPGKGFGQDDYIRISFAASIPELEKGMDRIATWFTKL